MNDPRTVRRTLRPSLLNHGYASSRVVLIGENRNRNMFTSNAHAVPTSNDGSTDPSDCVLLVQPSSWAKLDICTQPFYRSVFEGDVGNRIDIETSNIVTDRRSALMDECLLRARLKGKRATLPAVLHDVISFTCTRDPELARYNIMGWSTSTMTADQNTQGAHTERTTVTAAVGPTFVVGDFHDSGDDRPCADERMPDSYVSTEKLFISLCKDPNHKLDAHLSSNMSRKSSPSTPRSRLRQATLSYNRHTCDLLLYPGDTITILRPTNDCWYMYKSLFISQISQRMWLSG